MKSAHRVLLAIAILAGCISAWTIWDVVQGKQGVEELFLVVPMLIASLVIAISLLRGRYMRRRVAPVPPSDPLVAAQRYWRFTRLSLGVVTVLIGLTIITWIVRTGTLLVPLFVGAMALIITWTIVVSVLRPKGKK